MTDWQIATSMTSGHPYRVLVSGKARAGKDTVAALLAKVSKGALRSGPSTSEFYCRKVYGKDWTRELMQFKASPEGRAELAAEIDQYNRTHRGPPHWPGAQLYGEMVHDGIDLLVGIRRLEEVKACVQLHLLTHAVWVGRDVERDTTLDYDETDLITTCLPLYMLDNYGELRELPARVERCWEAIVER